MSEHHERQRAIRAVVAAQWAVAISLFASGAGKSADPTTAARWCWCIDTISECPTAEQIVDGAE